MMTNKDMLTNNNNIMADNNDRVADNKNEFTVNHNKTRCNIRIIVTIDVVIFLSEYYFKNILSA